LVAAGQLAAPFNTELVLVARAAFTHAMVWVAVVSAVIAVSTAAVTALLLRDVGIGGKADRRPQRDTEAAPITLAAQPVPTAK
jgi:hypothetical protein